MVYVINTLFDLYRSIPPNKSSSRNRLLIRRLVLGPRPVQHLEELRRLRAHPAVDVRLGALYVVVQVVPEHVYQVNGVVAG